MSAASGVAKYPCLLAHPWMVRTTRPISCLTLRSRSGVPSTPRKYFETTTFVATCDQVVGISTSCCSKTTSPFSLVMLASRVSHWTSSNGATARRVALFSSAFWVTFPEFARYRLKRLWPAPLGLAGAILLIWGLVLLFRWLLAYYAARLGHPLG